MFPCRSFLKCSVCLFICLGRVKQYDSTYKSLGTMTTSRFFHKCDIWGLGWLQKAPGSCGLCQIHAVWGVRVTPAGPAWQMNSADFAAALENVPASAACPVPPLSLQHGVGWTSTAAGTSAWHLEQTCFDQQLNQVGWGESGSLRCGCTSLSFHPLCSTKRWLMAVQWGRCLHHDICNDLWYSSWRGVESSAVKALRQGRQIKTI